MSLIVIGSVPYDGVETPHGKVDRMLGGAATYISLSSSYFTKVGIVGVVGDDFVRRIEDHQALRANFLHRSPKCQDRVRVFALRDLARLRER